ncbi:iron chelate uptake ABC transporter family permease subunit [Microbacterium sp. No. 7]|uniref:iron chelate uptake ABC transporter family permease subunit n=1 Tax=Microbacterium sp. No. 7 TaxID=1714373 RepID=UPI0006CF9E9F|nr:iron chelate uptake ABC transporter family permease subunit [Microbacterium sp. No. 7]ALJ18562.1 ABC transporter permease [Microbacterium sp. No. 7]
MTTTTADDAPATAVSAAAETIGALRRRRALGFAVTLVVLVVCCLLSLAIGSQRLSLAEVVDALSGAPGDAGTIVRDMRVPRTVLGVLVGAALGVAGALMQAFTRNPLADPGILGVNAGAAFAVAVGAAAFGLTSLSGTIWFAFAGAVVATVAVYFIGTAGRGAPDPLRITLAGIAIGAFLGGVTSGVSLLLPQVFNRMRGWNAGSIASVPADLMNGIVPFIVVGLVLAFLVAKPLNAVALGDELAAALGSRVVTTRVVSIVASTLLCAGATAAAGPIGFVGLMVPHVVRWFTGPDQRWIFAGSAVAAPVLVLASDIVGRLVLSSGELPVGIVTAFVGAPVLIVLVRRRKASGL